MTLIACNHYETCKKPCVFRYGIDTSCIDWHNRVTRLGWDSYYADKYTRAEVDCPKSHGHYVEIPQR
jgi:hypothetical protein